MFDRRYSVQKLQVYYIDLVLTPQQVIQQLIILYCSTIQTIRNYKVIFYQIKIHNQSKEKFNKASSNLKKDFYDLTIYIFLIFNPIE